MKFQSAFALMAIAGAANAFSRSGPDYQFPGFDVVESTGETYTYSTSGRHSTDLSISWADGFGERHSIQFEDEASPLTYAFFPTEKDKYDQTVFRYYDGARWKKEVVTDDCKWVLVEFLLRSGEFYPEPYIKMDLQCVTWKTPEEQDTVQDLKRKCMDGLRNPRDLERNLYCDKAIESGMPRAEDIISYGE